MAELTPLAPAYVLRGRATGQAPSEALTENDVLLRDDIGGGLFAHTTPAEVQIILENLLDMVV